MNLAMGILMNAESVGNTFLSYGCKKIGYGEKMRTERKTLCKLVKNALRTNGFEVEQWSNGFRTDISVPKMTTSNFKTKDVKNWIIFDGVVCLNMTNGTTVYYHPDGYMAVWL